MAQTNDDPYRWLEDVDDPEALAWVEERNERFLEKIRRDNKVDAATEAFLEILDDDEKIDYPRFRGRADRLYNFRQDAKHVRGILRRTTVEQYLEGDPDWEVYFDVDALAEKEGVDWVFKGGTGLFPDYERTLLSFSRGGADAVEMREFDLRTGQFVENGFVLPEAKQGVTWIDEETVVVGTDFGEGSMTTSGYPRILKKWRRGTPLSEAETIFEGESTDVSLQCWAVPVGGDRYIHVIHRAITFYEHETYLMVDDGVERIDIPNDAYFGTFDDQMLLTLISDTTFGDRSYRAGSLLAIDFEAFRAGSRKFAVLFEPDERSALEDYSRTKDYLLVETLEDVRSRIYRYSFDGESWQRTQVPAPDIAVSNVVSADEHSNRFFLTVNSPLTPTTLYFADLDESDELQVVRQQKEYFDTDGLITEQHHATSSDGTRIPYFIVRRADIPFDGSTPTILWGYGGFRVSQLPRYSAITGRGWLEQGGAFVTANIRGGGEFGPTWHAAALKENRQLAYDDFIAVAEDLIERKITSPEHLGIYGGSNGGLLVGATFVQRPDLMNAVVCGVPLLDMRNYHTMLAGASWMAEYGDPDKPEEWAYISRYSPYHNLKTDGEYPEVLFTTSTRDDRVHPGHARKMAARMEEMGHPYLYFENIVGGHGGATNNRQIAERYAMIYAYFRWKLFEGS